MMWLERLRQDAYFGIRLVLKAPAFSAIAILTLAIGVGASTAIFSQINAVFWKRLPVSNPQELRGLVWSSRKPSFVGGPNVIAGPHLAVGDTYGSVSYPAYLSMRDGAKSFANLACWADLGEGRPVVMREVGFGAVQFVSGNYFETVGVSALFGRTLNAADDAPGTRAAVLTYPFWQRTFGGDPGVVRRTIDLNGQPFTVVGVTPPSFFGVDPSTTPDVMVPMGAIQIAAATINPLQSPTLWQVCRVVGRLRGGVSDEHARVDAEQWLHEAIRAHPPQTDYEMPRVWLVDAGHGLGTLRDAMFRPLTILMGAVLGILLIACANMAGLLVVRGAARQREIATRLALGASRGRVVRQLLTESLLLSIAGGLVGLALAYALARVSPALMSRFLPTLYGANRRLGVVVAPDTTVLLFSAIISMVTGVVFGCVPALCASRVDLIASIKQSAPSGRGLSRLPTDKLMVSLQTALSVMIIIGAGLLLRTIIHLRSEPLGYQPEGLLYAKIEPRTGGVPRDRRGDFFEQAVKHLEQIPGVISTTATDAPPLGRPGTFFLAGLAFPVCATGYAPPDPREATALVKFVAPRYFETLRSRLISGREFDWRDRIDRPGAPLVAVVNEAFARTFFAGTNPVEQRFGVTCPARPAEVRVLGVVADAKDVPRQKNSPMFYMPLSGTGEVVTLILRTSARPEDMIPTIRRAMAEFNVTVPTFGEITPVDLREQQMQQERLLTTILLSFGAVALVLSSIGIYGMLAYMVARRTSEIGLRMALGAQATNVVGMVVRASILPVSAGLVAGAVGALVSTRWIDPFLFGVSPYDPWTIVGAAGLFLMIAAAAAIVPARRAANIDPLRALRVE